MDDDETLVIACVLGAVAITMIANEMDSKKVTTINPLIGGFVLGSLLLAVGLWSPAVAKSFSVVLLATAVVTNGTGLFKAISNATKQV